MKKKTCNHKISGIKIDSTEDRIRLKCLACNAKFWIPKEKWISFIEAHKKSD